MKAAVITLREAENTAEARTAAHRTPTLSRPSLKQPNFNLKAAYKYNELINF